MGLSADDEKFLESPRTSEATKNKTTTESNNRDDTTKHDNDNDRKVMARVKA